MFNDNKEPNKKNITLHISPRTMCPRGTLYDYVCVFWVINAVRLQMVRGNHGMWKAAANW